MCKTAKEAGWRVSRYNIAAPVPGTDKAAIANLFKGTCGAYTPTELYLLDELDTLDEGHPILKRFRERGLIVNFDERAALDALGRFSSAGRKVGLTVCPTMGCNFDCPYCFENHRSGRMSAQTQDDVIALAGRMMELTGAKSFHVTWFGGEPLLAPDIIGALSERFIDLAEKNGAEYSAEIITNGYLLTLEAAETLARCCVDKAQITLDGIGEAHDRTRHLAGGGATFERITENLRQKLSFSVNIRHNVHAGNMSEVKELKAFVDSLAKESGNEISYYPALVRDNDASDSRGGVDTLCGAEAGDIGVMTEARRFSAGRGHYCMAHTLTGLGVDDAGRLFKCWEDVDKPEHSFGSAARWDPADPIATADNPDMLTCYICTALSGVDAECLECVWLPMCVGGCPNKRLFYKKQCLPFRDEPEKYVFALYARIKNS